MNIEPTPLHGAVEVKPSFFNDKRGFFFEWLNTNKFSELSGIQFEPVQFNCSRSTKGVLRGMHFQNEPTSQAKLVGVNYGKIQDVIIDLRPESPSYGKHASVIIDDQQRNQLFVPKGFAHGFLVLSEEAEIFYAIDDFYSPQDEGGLNHNDPALNIDWLIKDNELILSDKDLAYQPFTEREFNFSFNE